MMKNKIFRSIFGVTLGVLLLATVIIFGMNYSYFDGQLTTELSQEAAYVGAGVEQSGLSYLDRLSDSKMRITWVATDGSVLYDNQADIAAMGNHADREEIKAALENGSGMATRRSDTLSERTVYYALRLADRSVIRVSSTQYSLWAIVMSMLQPIAVVLVAAFVFAAVIAYRLSDWIVHPISTLDLDHPEQNKVYEELQPVVEKLTLQNRKIYRQMEELKVRQTEFDAITTHMTEGMIVINARAEILSCNRCAKEMLGVSGTLPKSVLMLDRRDSFREAVRAALGGKNGLDTLRTGNRYYSILTAPVHEEEDGELLGAVIVILDETEKEERERLRREFTSNVSHELKTPLTSISGFAELMKSGMTDTEDAKHFADNIYREARRLIVLVGDIIRLTQLDGGEIPYDEMPVNPADVANEVVERLENVAKAAGVTLRVCADGDGQSVLVDGNRQILEEMLYNLCDNGVKYNRSGGFVEIAVAREKDGAVVTVRDNGIGIPKGEQSRVFERFYRVDKSHSKAIGGTGLGLSIVKHGANYHKAQILLESEPNVGTTITLHFPGSQREVSTRVDNADEKQNPQE